ncbi:MAG TPA: cytochrome-c peroxidase [Gammaproteobacteria bacterium]|nr:cytochrome-c peroxidase [Gammaproteobacteria bacterium]
MFLLPTRLASVVLALLTALPLGAGETVPALGPLPPVAANPDNLPTPARMELGRRLFFDNRISASGKLNCSSCHLPDHGWTLPLAISLANDGFVERRNPPTLINVGYNRALIWDGRAPSLEKQALGSTRNPVHKGQDIPRLMAVLNADPDMVARFQAAYGRAPNPTDYGKALAVFQRHFLVTGDSPFDRYMKGDKLALSEAARKGLALFQGKAGCSQCHNGPNFTDYGFYNIGLKRNPLFDQPAYAGILHFDAKRMGLTEWAGITDDPGRYLVTHDEKDWKAFKTPTLRNVEHTAPYMHDGRYATLDEVIAHYNRGGDGTPHQDRRIKALGLSAAEQAALKAFLLSLTGPLPPLPH